MVEGPSPIFSKHTDAFGFVAAPSVTIVIALGAFLMAASFSVFALVGQLVLAAASPIVQAPPASDSFRIDGIEVTGGKRYASAEIAKLSGLAIGQSIRVPELAIAANRLAETGLFKSINYRYVTTAARITVTFEFDEADWIVPVVFDNFVWFPDKELIAGVARAVPSFDGNAPATEGVINL
jgi:outer membrane protein assembly factor BamA